MKHLIGQGHKCIVHFRGDKGVRSADLRHRGYQRALEEAGIAYSEELVIPGQFTVDSGRERSRAMLAGRSDNLPTAIFCANDAIAFGSMDVFSSAGLAIPEDISVAGFDDTLLARITTPRLTTIRQPVREMGQKAVSLLKAKVIADNARHTSLASSNNTATPQNTEATGFPSSLFEVELIIRGSVGPPRHL